MNVGSAQFSGSGPSFPRISLLDQVRRRRLMGEYGSVSERAEVIPLRAQG